MSTPIFWEGQNTTLVHHTTPRFWISTPIFWEAQNTVSLCIFPSNPCLRYLVPWLRLNHCTYMLAVNIALLPYQVSAILGLRDWTFFIQHFGATLKMAVMAIYLTMLYYMHVTYSDNFRTKRTMVQVKFRFRSLREWFGIQRGWPPEGNADTDTCSHVGCIADLAYNHPIIAHEIFLSSVSGCKTYI